MPSTFDVQVVAADRQIFLGPAVSVVVPALDGYLGILRGHAPLYAALTVGVITIQLPDTSTPLLIAVSGGFVEVSPEKTLVLADAAELAEDIDLERAEQSKQRAEERLRSGGPDTDLDRAKAALLRALNRLRAV
ncbi:MAG TPA: ATP synthase F1 subunit epsilon, partial [Armatimonadota bacterium]